MIGKPPQGSNASAGWTQAGTFGTSRRPYLAPQLVEQHVHQLVARLRFRADTYRAGDDDPTRMVPNPAKKPAYQQVEKARRALHLAETARDRELAEKIRALFDEFGATYGYRRIHAELLRAGASGPATSWSAS